MSEKIGCLRHLFFLFLFFFLMIVLDFLFHFLFLPEPTEIFFAMLPNDFFYIDFKSSEVRFDFFHAFYLLDLAQKLLPLVVESY